MSYIWIIKKKYKTKYVILHSSLTIENKIFKYFHCGQSIMLCFLKQFIWHVLYCFNITWMWSLRCGRPSMSSLFLLGYYPLLTNLSVLATSGSLWSMEVYKGIDIVWRSRMVSVMYGAPQGSPWHLPQPGELWRGKMSGIKDNLGLININKWLTGLIISFMTIRIVGCVWYVSTFCFRPCCLMGR